MFWAYLANEESKIQLNKKFNTKRLCEVKNWNSKLLEQTFE